MKYEVFYLRHDMSERRVRICAKVVNHSVEAFYEDDEGRSGNIVAKSYFDFLWDLHSIYSDLGFQILCIGLLNDVFPGGLASDSTSGRSVYQINEKDRTKELVDVFTKINQNEICNISTKEGQRKQREFVIKNHVVGDFKILNENKVNKETKKVIDDILNKINCKSGDISGGSS